MTADALNGLLVLDKPRGPTSRDAVNRVQRLLPRGTKIGHTGTLDPLATGVLVVCLGPATRLAEYVQNMNKSYRTTVLLGHTSDTNDADGQVTPTADARPVPREVVESALTRFVDVIDQVPPAFSAAKVAGKRAHALARAGEIVELRPRRVMIYSTTFLSYDWPRLELDVHCGKGTYIRSLARDLGAALGCGGLVEVLRRTAVGPFTPDQAVPTSADLTGLVTRLIPPEQAVSELPRVQLATAREAERFRSGQAVACGSGELVGDVGVFDAAGRLVGVGAAGGGGVRPVKVVG